jgi:hypothetical protein
MKTIAIVTAIRGITSVNFLAAWCVTYVPGTSKIVRTTRDLRSYIEGRLTKPDTENIRDLNLAAVKRTTVQASRLLS